ncbi:MAG: caspase family protein [Elainellaceae cyanobacterium]
MSRDALVIGIGQYENLENLKAAARDSEAIAQRLERDGGFRVRRLPEVSRDGALKVAKTQRVFLPELKQALVDLFKPDGEQYPDTALLHFSGHGVRDSLGLSDGYLATSEANLAQNFFGLQLRWLRRLLEESPVRQQVVWLDCCHSGEILNFGEADPGERRKGRDRCFVAASRDYQLAYE